VSGTLTDELQQGTPAKRLQAGARGGQKQHLSEQPCGPLQSRRQGTGEGATITGT